MKKVLICGHRSFVATGLMKELENNGICYDCFSRGEVKRDGEVVWVESDLIKIKPKGAANGELDEYQLLLCSHILWKMEEVWILDNPQGVNGAWLEINKAISKFHPEYTLIIN